VANLPRMEESGTATATSELGAAAVDLLGELISIDTSNPPGNERPVQELLADRLSAVGFECELLAARGPERPNLVARLRGEKPGPTLCYLGHADTVPADPSEWSFSPWAGDVADGMVRGRGAQDMKDQVAAEAAACIALAARGWRPAGELLLVVTADEEAGATIGAKWLCEEHPDKVRADFVVNEGGGASFELDGRRHYELCVGEKGVFRFLLRTHGRAGHASVPGLGDNALLKLAPLVARLREQPPPEANPAGVVFLSTLLGEDVGEDPALLAGALERLRERSPLLASYLAEPMLGVTLVPTKADASHKDNVIPSKAEVLVDCRVPPGGGKAEVLRAVNQVLGDGTSPAPGGDEEAAGLFDVDFVEDVTGNASPFDTPLAQAITAWIEENDPGATVVPIVMSGFSDSHWWRKAFDSATVYGFCPQNALNTFESSELVHAADERIPVADVELGAKFFHDLAQRLLS
jgi:acetylornithine deacetylase/succinyl-diaminopimelate desuccinylase-like protein